MQTETLYNQKMRRTLYVMGLMLFLAFPARAQQNNAQVKISTSQLNGTEWQIESYERSGKIRKYDFEIVTCKYAMSSLYEKAYYPEDGDSICYRLPYYITDVEPIDFNFDKSKVGVNSTGRYLVRKGDIVDYVDYDVIMSFNDDEMVLLHKGSDDTIGGNEDVYVKWKRIK